MSNTIAENFNDILFCSKCGSITEFKVPPDDNLPRAVCTNCKLIHYQNPVNIVGTIPLYQNKILLCKRNIEPKLGYWTLPAGFLELNETLEQGAYRETKEEAGMPIEILRLFSIIDVPAAGQIHFYFLANIVELNFNFGAETQEVKLFEFEQIPWNEISFRTVSKNLDWLIQHHQQNYQANSVYTTTIND